MLYKKYQQNIINITDESLQFCFTRFPDVVLFAVAMNYQTCGLMMDLNEGRFMQNGSCGYVLKPAVMREEIAFFSANTRDIIPGVSPQILHLKVSNLFQGINPDCLLLSLSFTWLSFFRKCHSLENII